MRVLVSDDDGDYCNISYPLDFSDDSNVESASEDEQGDDDQVGYRFLCI